MKKLVLTIMFFILISLPVNAFAGLEPSPFSFYDTVAFDNPILRVLFNPQPEPPGSWMHITDASNPLGPVFTVHNDASGLFRLAFDIDNATVPLSYHTGVTQNEIMFYIFTAGLGSMVPELAYTATFSFNGLNLGSDVMFNPQPEPPGFPSWITFSLMAHGDTVFGAGSDVAMTLRFTDVNGQLVALTAVPEPATMLLVGFGLFGLAAARRRFQN